VRTELRSALVLLLLLTLVTGVAYPLLITGVARLVFPHQAEGSLIQVGGHAVGSHLIGQTFDEPKYFWGRLSATGPVPYNAASSSGSNYGPLNPALFDAARARITALKQADPTATGPVPVDLVTASGSGLDPHISPAAAEYQVARVAKARALTPDQVGALVRAHTARRTWGVLGEPVVNVLELNLDLDAQFGNATSRAGGAQR
jgi:K+-transporting ATPase ATPase C chain